MFTGIVQGRGKVEALKAEGGILHLQLKLPAGLSQNVDIGASVAVNGTCLTVTAQKGDILSFDAMGETLAKTRLGDLHEGDLVHIERAARIGDEIGGHEMSGHIDGLAEIINIERPDNNFIMHFQLPENLKKYVFKKGYIGIHGCSLTVADIDRGSGVFTVCLIPETLRVTTFGDMQAGDKCHIEIDRKTQAIVDTITTLQDESRD